MPDPWGEGDRIIAPGEVDLPLSVATATRASTGEIVILVRFGDAVAVLSPLGARRLALALSLEADRLTEWVGDA